MKKIRPIRLMKAPGADVQAMAAPLANLVKSITVPISTENNDEDVTLKLTILEEDVLYPAVTEMATKLQHVAAEHGMQLVQATVKIREGK